MTPLENCVICHGYHDGMLRKAGETFCRDCWDLISKEVIDDIYRGMMAAREKGEKGKA